MDDIETDLIDLNSNRPYSTLIWCIVILAIFLLPIYFVLAPSKDQAIMLMIPESSNVEVDDLPQESTRFNLSEGVHTIIVRSPNAPPSINQIEIKKSKHLKVYALRENKLVAVGERE